MSPAVFSPAALRLQPFAFLVDGVYAKTRGAGPVRLVTGTGAGHPLRRIADWRAWDHDTARLTRPVVASEVARTLAAREDAIDGDPAAFFVSVLVPAFLRRESGEDEPSAPLDDDLLDDVLREVPPLRMPMPGLLIGSRVWALAPNLSDRRLSLHTPSAILSLTGAAVSLSHVDDRWRRETRCAIQHIAAGIESRRHPVSPLSGEAARELEWTGALVRGDLVFLRGVTPRLGHLLPDHFNQTLGRPVARDLLLAAPFRRASPRELQLFARGPDHHWRALAASNGLCLGADAPPAPTVSRGAWPWLPSSGRRRSASPAMAAFTNAIDGGI